MLQMNRRGLLGGLIAFVAAAPAVVRATSLMPIKAWIDPLWRSDFYGDAIRRFTFLDAAGEVVTMVEKSGVIHRDDPVDMGAIYREFLTQPMIIPPEAKITLPHWAQATLQ